MRTFYITEIATYTVKAPTEELALERFTSAAFPFAEFDSEVISRRIDADTIDNETESEVTA